MIDPALVSGVELLCLDAGNTVIFLDHARFARIVGEHGFHTTAAALEAAEGRAKVRADERALVDVPWKDSGAPGALGWGRVVATIMTEAGLPERDASRMVELVWAHHMGSRNLWDRVPEGLIDALHAYRAKGGRVVIVSNSEGALEPLLESLGVVAAVDMVIDSGRVGVEKPDPRIFQIALGAYDIAPAHALHLGDTYSTDVLGARAAGVRVALIDPFSHYAGRYADVPRVPGAEAVARALTAARN